jgi:hypothetical protein
MGEYEYETESAFGFIILTESNAAGWQTAYNVTSCLTNTSAKKQFLAYRMQAMR